MAMNNLLVTETTKEFAKNYTCARVWDETYLENGPSFTHEYTNIVCPWLDETGRVWLSDDEANALYGEENINNLIVNVLNYRYAEVRNILREEGWNEYGIDTILDEISIAEFVQLTDEDILTLSNDYKSR